MHTDDQARLNELENNAGLDDWETTFIDDISNYMGNGGFLSEQQQEKLLEVYRKHFPGGDYVDMHSSVND